MTKETEAFKSILDHHRSLEDDVSTRVGSLQQAVEAGVPYEPAVAELVAYLGGEVFPHALAEEHSIYRVASARAELADTVNEMITEHRSLAAGAERLASASNGEAAAAQAQEIATLFATHVAKENDVLLPPLVAESDVDLAELVVQMHRLTEAAQDEGSLVEDASTPDPPRRRRPSGRDQDVDDRSGLWDGRRPGRGRSGAGPDGVRSHRSQRRARLGPALGHKPHVRSRPARARDVVMGHRPAGAAEPKESGSS